MFIENQCRNFRSVGGEVTDYFVILHKCINPAEGCADQVAYSRLMGLFEPHHVVHRPLHRKLDTPVTATVYVNEPQGVAVDVDTGKQVFSQLSRIL
jgi:hypothetical protein